MRLKHLLVPTDFGESSQHAEDLAAELASKFDAKITLLHVWSVPAPAYAEALSWPIAEIEAAAGDALAHAHARLEGKDGNSEAVLAAGVAWDRIVEMAKQRDVDMVVIGTHGRRGVPRFLLGSVAERVVRLSHASVLTVSSESCVTPIKKILVPIDMGPGHADLPTRFEFPELVARACNGHGVEWDGHIRMDRTKEPEDQAGARSRLRHSKTA